MTQSLKENSPISPLVSQLFYSKTEDLCEDLEKMDLKEEKPLVKPPIVKPYFMKKDEVPFSLQDYDSIGFNAACLVKWNEAQMRELIISGHLKDLVELNPTDYPEKLKDIRYNYNASYGLTQAVWDIQNGTVLKLTDGKRITHALLGFKPLTKEEIQEMYGKEMIFEALKFPETVL
jgi:hypothetical protein